MKRSKPFVADMIFRDNCLMHVVATGCESRSGKVRDIFDLGKILILLTTDRISAFDVILKNGVPYKGWLINQISLFWFDYFKNLVSNHVVVDIPRAFQLEALAGRITVCRKMKRLPIECVVRGYLTGSGWKSYQQNGSVCGISLPPGILECGQLPAPIFTPTTKAESGHDENLTFDQMAEILAGMAPRRPSIKWGWKWPNSSEFSHRGFTGMGRCMHWSVA